MLKLKFCATTPGHAYNLSQLWGGVKCEVHSKGIKINIKYNIKSLEGYQIKGKAAYVIEGTVVDTFKSIVENMFHGAATAKGALIITPEKVIVTTPGSENKKLL